MTEEKQEIKKEEVKVETPKEEKKEEKTKVEEAPKEEPKEEKKEVKIPTKFKKIVEEIESMSVLELHELVKFLEEKFGVSSVAVAVTGAGNGAGEVEEEKDSFTVELKSVGDSKIGVIKAVKAALGLGLSEAKDLVESAPTSLKEGVNKKEAEELKKIIEEGGGTVELK